MNYLIKKKNNRITQLLKIMKPIATLLNIPIKKILLASACFLLLTLACKKENSSPPPPPPPPPPPDSTLVSLFTTQVPKDTTLYDSAGAIEVGVKFKSTVGGVIEGIKFYKSTGNLGTHIAQLYDAGGKLLASQQSQNETANGWQTVMFTTGIPITAKTTYIAAYFSSLGNYVSEKYGLQTAITNGPITFLADSTEGYNGTFKYTATPAVPDSGYLSSNYWVDIIEKIEKK
jgi:Domain of unknown function (DUF4082)